MLAHHHANRGRHLAGAVRELINLGANADGGARSATSEAKRNGRLDVAAYLKS
uniref:hypothetical protein n=1 Tax=uncultured Caulobacter sp. TaxID=158749 RepID=UPI0025D4F0E1|nr:hypothetical protein [uncultured Caulobacter sp.]